MRKSEEANDIDFLDCPRGPASRRWFTKLAFSVFRRSRGPENRPKTVQQAPQRFSTLLKRALRRPGVLQDGNPRGIPQTSGLHKRRAEFHKPRGGVHKPGGVPQNPGGWFHKPGGGVPQTQGGPQTRWGVPQTRASCSGNGTSSCSSGNGGVGSSGERCGGEINGSCMTL